MLLKHPCILWLAISIQGKYMEPKLKSRPKLSSDKTFQPEIISDHSVQTKISSDQTFQTQKVSDQTFQTEVDLIRPSSHHCLDSNSEHCPNPNQTMSRPSIYSQITLRLQPFMTKLKLARNRFWSDCSALEIVWSGREFTFEQIS